MDVFKNDVVLDFPDIHKIDFIKINKNYFKVILVNFFLFLIPLLAILIVLQQFTLYKTTAVKSPKASRTIRIKERTKLLQECKIVAAQ